MICPYAKACCMELKTPAEIFLHKELHEESWEGLGNAVNLHGLPYALFPRIARLMADYHEFASRGEIPLDA